MSLVVGVGMWREGDFSNSDASFAVENYNVSLSQFYRGGTKLRKNLSYRKGL